MLTVLSDKQGIQEGGAALARSATALKVWNFSLDLIRINFTLSHVGSLKYK